MARRNARSGASGRRGSKSTSAKAKRPIGYTAGALGRHIRKLFDEQEATAHIVQLVYDTYGPSALSESWDEFVCRDSETGPPFEFTAESPFLELFISWLAHTWTPAKMSEQRKGATSRDKVPTRTFLVAHPDLDPLLAKYLTACTETPFSFFEVVKREAGRRFTCRDLICGTRHVVPDGAAATLLRAHQVVYARIVEVDGAMVIDTAAPWPLPEDMTPAILALRDVILEHPSGVEPAHARAGLLAHELDVRNFYWGFLEEAFKDGSLRPQLRYTHSLHTAAERLLKTLAPRRTAAEQRAENARLLAIPEVRQQVVSIFTYMCENWVNEKLPLLGGKTALESVATPEGRLKVQALMDEIETDFSMLPFSLDPQIFRRMRERLGLSPTKGLH